MDILQLPFNKLLGIKKSSFEAYIYQLDAKVDYTNHLGTVHAAALFALAEGTAGQFLMNILPQWVEKVIPVVRKSEISYKKPANGIIVSSAKLKNDSVENINHQLETKKRISIITEVELFDENKVKVFVSKFETFVVVK